MERSTEHSNKKRNMMHFGKSQKAQPVVARDSITSQLPGDGWTKHAQSSQRMPSTMSSQTAPTYFGPELEWLKPDDYHFQDDPKHPSEGFGSIFPSWGVSKSTHEAMTKDRDTCRARISELQHEVHELRSEIEGRVRAAQDAAFRMTSNDTVKSMDDDDVRRRIHELTKNWRLFAQDWATKSVDHLRVQPLTSMPKTIVTLRQYSLPQEVDEFLQSPQAGEILLEAELAQFIARHIIQQPFLRLVSLQNSSSEASNDFGSIVKSFGSFYDMMIKNDAASAHDWRSKTLSLMNTYDHKRIDQGGPSLSPVLRSEKFQEDLASTFENSLVKLFFSKVSSKEAKDRHDDLTDLFKETQDLFSILWAQKESIEVWFGEPLDAIKYCDQHPWLEAHITHRLDQGDTRMDGARIQLVVSPAIIARGDQYGKNYEGRKEWAKAIVRLLPHHSRMAPKNMDLTS